MFITGLCAGIIGMFLLQRIVDAICKKGGFECDYDCSQCKTRCAGYHCGTMRKYREEHPETCAVEVGDESPLH